MRALVLLRLSPLLATLALAGAACTESSTPRGASRERTIASGPGAALVTFNYPAQKSRTDPGGWGPVLTDIENHLPSKYGSTYYDSDRVTHGHETTHGINSELRNSHNNTGTKANGFYLLQNRAVVIAEPNMSKARVAQLVPGALQGSRFSLYVSGQTAWNDRPLYLFDEWVAYINGAAVGVDLMKRGKWTYGQRDAVAGAMEFVAYGVATAKAVELYDPTYFAQNGQFREFVAYCLQHAMALFYQGKDYPAFQFQSQSTLFAALTGSAGKPIRDWVIKTYGKPFSDAVFFNQGTTPGADSGVTPPQDAASSPDSAADSAADSGVSPDAGGPAAPDKQAPKIVILSPSANERVAQKITVRAQITDNVGVVDAELYLGELLAASASAGPWDFVVHLPPGPALLRIIARDKAGNRGEASVRVEVEGEPVPEPPHPEEPDPGPAPAPPQTPPQQPPSAPTTPQIPPPTSATGSTTCSAVPDASDTSLLSILALLLLAASWRRQRRARYLPRKERL